MKNRTSLATGPLAAAVILALWSAPAAAQEQPYLLQGGGEIRVLRGLEPAAGFEAAPQAVEEAQTASSDSQAETSSEVDAEVFELAEGRWMSQWQTPRSGTTTAKTTFDEYGRMSSIPGPYVTFYAANQAGQWEGFWVEDSGSQRCASQNDGKDHWGVVRFQFNADYTRFEGTWDHCGEGQQWEWKGKRVGN